MKKIAIYGKGGIGKSTVATNLSASLAAMGKTVMQIGCDPKADSTKSLTGGNKINTVLDCMREKKNNLELKDIVVESNTGVLCVESGGPIPGTGCAGRGIITAFEQLDALKAFEIYKPDIVIYDVLGDVVCGGFAMPIRQGYADKVYIVTSGEMMSLYAADNIAHAVKNFAKRKYASLGGLIFNAKGFDSEFEAVENAAKEMDTQIFFRIPRNSIVQEAENVGLSVVEYAPENEMSLLYKELASKIMETE